MCLGSICPDQIQPTTTYNITGGTLGLNGWYVSYVRVALNCTDNTNGAGCKQTLYCIDSSNTCSPNLTYSSQIQINSDGIKYLRYFSQDNANNNETTKSLSIKVDTNRPDPVVYILPPLPDENDTIRFYVSPKDVSGGSGINHANLTVDGVQKLICTSFRCEYIAGTYPLGSNHTYSSIAMDNAGNVRTSTLKNFTISNEPFCEYLIKEGEESEKLDILFMGHAYDNITLYRENINASALTLLSIEPFKTNSNKINILFINKTTDLGCSATTSERCDASIIQTFASACPHDQIILLTYNMGAGIALGNIAVAQWNSPPTVVHEFGHSFGGLSDEYSSGYTVDSAPGAVNCDVQGCPKWIDNVTGAGCFQICKATNWYRAANHSIMFDGNLSAGYGPVSELHLESLLQKYG